MIKNNITKQGFSLIEILVVVGVSVVVFSFIGDLLIKQHKEQKLVSQKLEINDFKNNVLSIFSKKNNCTCQFLNNSSNPNVSNYSVLKFNSTITTGTEVINNGKLFSGCAGGSNPPVLLAADGLLLNNSQSLIVDTVKIVNLVPSGGALNPNEWQGQWEIKLKVAPGSLDRPIKPMTFTQKFMIDPTIPTAARITSCEGMASGSGTINYLTKWSAVPGVVEDSIIYQDPGNDNVGIGTNIPMGQLHVSNSVPFDPWGMPLNSVVLGNTNHGGWWGPGVIMSNSTSGSNLGAIAFNGDNLYFGQLTAVGKKDTMVIDSNGNVGIGTLTPRSALSVFKNLNDRAEISISTPGSQNLQQSVLALVSKDDGNTLGASPANRGWAVYARGDTYNYASENTPNKFGISYWDGTSWHTPYFNITPAGNVGIGTFTPIAPLHVQTSSTQQVGRFESSNANGSDVWISSSGLGGRQYVLGSTANGNAISGGKFTIADATAGGVDRLVIDAVGNVGIGNTAPVRLLHVGSASVGTGQAVVNFQNVDGTCTITPASSGSGIACSSDERLKENFQDVTSTYALDRILQLQAVTFNFKTSSANSRRTGYKAQEVQKVAPDFVRKNEDGLLQVYYDAFIPWITEAIKLLYSRITGIEGHQAAQGRDITFKADKAEVKANIQKLEVEVEKLKQENSALKDRLEKIEKALSLE